MSDNTNCNDTMLLFPARGHYGETTVRLSWRVWLAAGWKMLAKDVVWFFGVLRIWRERGRQRRELASLGDRMLKDLGLTRAQVDCEIRKSFWCE